MKPLQMSRRTFGRLATLMSVGAAQQFSATAMAQTLARIAKQADRKDLIESGLKKLGLDGGYEIVVADSPDIVENTAAEMLQKFLGKAGLNIRIVPESKANGKKRFLLGRDANLQALTRLGDSGEVKIRAVSGEDDGFHLKRIGENFVVAGANPRGVLYGVYAFEDFVRADPDGNPDIKKIPYYRKRGSGPDYYHNLYINEDSSEDKVAYLSRIGINQWTAERTENSIHYLSQLVTSDIFPFQTPPRADLQRKVRSVSALCKKFGIDYYQTIWEPIIPELVGDLSKYPEEALGTVKPPWGGGKDGMRRTLCINSRIVQDHYRNIMRKFVREFPDVKGVVFYNLDCDCWLCTPELCERCKKVCTDSPPDKYNPWETQARLVTLLADAAHVESPDFDFRSWVGLHYKGEALEKLLRSSHGYDSLMSSWSGSDRDVMVPDVAEPAFEFVIAQKVGAERSVPLYAVHAANNLEPVPRSLPFPFHVCDALKKFKGWGVNHFMEVDGPVPAHNSINALVMKEFQWNPDQNPEEFLTSLSVRQFGDMAGPWMYKAWKEMQKAFDVWNDMPDNPLSGSHFVLSMGTSDGIPRPILPDIAKQYIDFLLVTLTGVEPNKANLYKKFTEKAFLDKMVLMNAHLSQAAEHARKAVSTASDKEFIGICYYEEMNGRPTRKEYAELNYASIGIANQLCRQRCNMLRAVYLLTEMESARAAGDEKSARGKEKLSQYHELIREDIGVQEDFRKLLMGFAAMRPCYTRTSLPDNEISDLLLTTRAKIDILKRFLESGKPLGFDDMPRNPRYRFSD